MRLTDEELLKEAKTTITEARQTKAEETCILCHCKKDSGAGLFLRHALALGDDFGALFHNDCWEL